MDPYKHTNSKGKSYYLFKKEVNLKGGKKQLIYFFAKDPNNEKGTPVPDLPEGKVVKENTKTGLPFLKND